MSKFIQSQFVPDGSCLIQIESKGKSKYSISTENGQRYSIWRSSCLIMKT